MSSYPICKSCSFLAIDFYEEISNTFEDCLSEALIPESTFILNKTSSGVLTVDKSHRSPWNSVPFDKAFILCEANKVEEYVADITENTALFPNKFKWNSSRDYVNSCKDFNEEEFLHEKDLSIFRGKVLHGKFQLLDVPQIPLPLLRSRKHSSIATLLKLLPIMDLDDPFDFNDISFEDNDTFFNVESKEGINRFPKNDDQMHFEELTLPELSIEERSNCEKIITNFQYDMKFKDVPETDEKSDTLKLPIAMLPESDKTFKHFSERYNNFNSIRTLNDHITTERSPKSNSQLKLDVTKTQEFTVSHNISTEEYTAVETMVENTSKNELGTNAVCLLNNMSNQSQHLNRCLNQQKFSGNRVCGETLDVDICVGNITDNKNTDTNFENILVNLKDHSNLHRTENKLEELNDIFNEFDDQEKSCIVPIETLTQFDFHQYSNVQGDQMKIEETPILNSHIIASYKEKLSSIQYQANINMKNIIQSGVTERKAPPENDLKQCTAFRSQVSSFKPANKNFQGKVIESCSKNYNLSQPVDLLSNFIQVQFPFQILNNELDKTSLKATSKSPFNYQLQTSTLASKLQVKEVEPCEKGGPESASKHFQEESIPMLVQLEVEDLLVELPEDYVKILLNLEEIAIPLLQYLMLSDQFKFPAHLTLADIPPYKTCFLLNQEVKRCQDKHINKGNMGKYYYHLLVLHGILKTVECFIHFDIHLALSSLHTYDRTHKSLVKRCYEKLIEKLEHEIDECFENNSVHPKVKELSQYLCDKYIFCQENHLKFKVLIILKKNLEAVCAAFERLLRQTVCNFRIYLIPESVFLYPNTLIFEGREDTVYFINASSLSNNIPWTELSFVIEFEQGSKSCWKQICSEQNIAHAFVKVVKLPLKSLKEIQNLNAPVSEKTIANPVVENVKLLIVSASITSQYQLLYLLESRFHYSICIRQYKEILPHLHFADIVVDEKSALILVSEVSFSAEDFSEMLSLRISFLHIKFEFCWIIVQKYIDKKNPDVSKCVKTNINFHKFYLSMVNLCCRNQSYKIKILFANNVDETTDLIKNISSISLRSKGGAYVNISIPSQITKEEIFLCSFPSLNPFVVNLMLFENNLSELLNFTAEEMCTKFYSVPQRFLHCFYSTNHKLCTLPSPEKYKEQSEFSENSSYGSSTGSNPKFQLKPNFPMVVNFSQNYNNSTAISYEDEHDISIPSQFLEYTTQIPFDNKKIDVSPSQEKSLQELDLDYMSLKICNKFEEYQSSYDDTPPEVKVSNSINMHNSSSKSNHQHYSPFTFETLSSQISNESYLDFDSNVEFDDNIENTYNHLLKVRSKSGFASNMENINLEHEVPRSQFHTKFHCIVGNSQHNINKPALDFNQFKYNPNTKRKLSTNDDSSPPVSKKACRIQKGMASKTVSKRDAVYKSPFDCQEMLPSPSPNRKEAKVFPFVIRKNCHESSKNGTSKTSTSVGDVNIFENHQFSQWSDSEPIGSFPLTPRVNRRLGFVGVSGQTKLVFQ